MKQTVRLACLMMALLMLFPLASCGGETAETADTAADTAPVETEPTDYLASLPEMDYDGYNFRMNIRDNDKWVNDQIAEEMNGEVVNDAVYKRNAEIMDRYNVAITHIRSSHANSDADAQANITAGDDAYDLVTNHPRQIHKYGNEGLALDWHKFKYVDLTQAYWDQDAARSFTMPDGGLYCMIGDNSHCSVGATFAMLFNKDLFDQFGLDYPYETVKEGKWTMDAFLNIAETYANDLDGDGDMDENDLYGYVTHHWVGPIQAFYSSGARVIEKDSDTYEFGVYNERSITMFEKYFALLDSSCSSIDTVTTSSFTGDHLPLFQEGKAMFVDVNLLSVEFLREMDFNFGIIPWPKLEESDKEYWSNVDAGTNLFFVPITAYANQDLISHILEAMAILGREYVIPAYYDVALKTRDSRDEESAEMLDIILANRVFDLGYWNTDFGGGYDSHFSELARNRTEFSSWYDKKLKSGTTQKEKVIQKYLDRAEQ
ncbi:MAG: extracellular solute-binding protein [Clostridia bacterium]|nr:extracellular solute-binding protein [Clostridia bacterium]